MVAKKPAAAMKRPAAADRDGESEDGLALSTTQTLNEKLAILRSNTSLSAAEKVKLLKTKLSSDEWVSLNGKASYAAKSNEDLKNDLETSQETGGS